MRKRTCHLDLRQRSLYVTIGQEYYSVQNQFERFRGFLELIRRFEFELRRRENYIFLKDSNFWCVHVNVPWPFCAHAIPFRMLWLPRFMMTEIYISMKPLWKVVQIVR